MNKRARFPVLSLLLAVGTSGVALPVVPLIANDTNRFASPPTTTGRRAGHTDASPTADASPAGPRKRTITRPGRPLTRPSDSRRGTSSTTGSLWKTVTVLGGIVCVILVGAKLLRKHAPKLSGGIPPEALEVLGKRTVDRGQFIYLVRLGSRILIIGSSPAGLQTLGEVTDPVEIDYLAGLCRPREQSSAVAQGFLALFNRRTDGGQTPSQFGDEPSDSDDTGATETPRAQMPTDPEPFRTGVSRTDSSAVPSSVET